MWRVPLCTLTLGCTVVTVAIVYWQRVELVWVCPLTYALLRYFLGRIDRLSCPESRSRSSGGVSRVWCEEVYIPVKPRLVRKPVPPRPWARAKVKPQ